MAYICVCVCVRCMYSYCGWGKFYQIHFHQEPSIITITMMATCYDAFVTKWSWSKLYCVHNILFYTHWLTDWQTRIHMHMYVYSLGKKLFFLFEHRTQWLKFIIMYIYYSVSRINKKKMGTIVVTKIWNVYFLYTPLHLDAVVIYTLVPLLTNFEFTNVPMVMTLLSHFNVVEKRQHPLARTRARICYL